MSTINAEHTKALTEATAGYCGKPLTIYQVWELLTNLNAFGGSKARITIASIKIEDEAKGGGVMNPVITEIINRPNMSKSKRIAIISAAKDTILMFAAGAFPDILILARDIEDKLGHIYLAEIKRLEECSDQPEH